ncbi:MAG: hypothetical protein AB7E66_03245, partial [Parvibaculaceae bacterium]
PEAYLHSLYPPLDEERIDLIEQEIQKPLPTSLRSLLGVLERWREQSSLSPSHFVQCLSDAYLAPPLPFSDAWRLLPADPFGGKREFEDCLVVLARQVADLRELQELGKLEDEFRYFGIDHPTGFTWYNFDVGTYLECAAAGTFGYHQRDGHPGNRVFLTEQDAMVEEGVTAIAELTWSDVIQFLDCGQSYE